MRCRPEGYTLIGLALLLLFAGVVVATITPLLLENLKTSALQEEKKTLAGVRDTALGFAMEQCRLPTADELAAYAPQYGLGKRTAYFVGTSPDLTSDKALSGMAADAATDLALRVPVQGAGLWRRNIAFLVYDTGLNRRRDLEIAGTECRARVQGEAFQLNGRTHVYDDFVRYVTLEALCAKTGCCQ